MIAAEHTRLMRGKVELSEWSVTPGTWRHDLDAETMPRKLSFPCVYVFEMIGTPFCKIGCCSDIRARFRNAQTHSPFELRWSFYLVPAAGISHIDVEAETHRRLAQWRGRGEWFECREWAANTIIAAHEYLSAQRPRE